MDSKVIIRFFNKNLDFIGEVDNFTSFILERKLFTFGKFELITNYNNNELFKIGNYIVVNNNQYKSAIIEEINIKNGIDSRISIKGYCIGGILRNRVTYPFLNKDTFYMNNYAENIMCELVKYNAINANDIKRNFENLIQESSSGRGNKLSFETRYKVLSDELETIASATKLGWCIAFEFNEKKFVFKCLEGKDSTINNTLDNPPVLFSKKFDNLHDGEYTKSTIDYKNCAITAGQGEGVNREIVIVNDNNSGLERREIFIDARDIKEGSNLADRGLIKLAEQNITENFEYEVNTEQYEKEWDLGDFVTIIDDEINVLTNRQVVEIREIYEEGILTLEPSFGEGITIFGDRFKQAINTPIIEATSTIMSIDMPNENAKGTKWIEIIEEEANGNYKK